MKSIVIICLFICTALLGSAQSLKFDNPSPFNTKEERSDKKVSITFLMEDATADCDVTVKINEGKSSATKDKDYVFSSPTIIKLKKADKYKGEIEITIKSDNFVEAREEVSFTFSYTDESKKEKEVEYTVYIFDLNDGTSDEPQLTPAETNINKHLSFELFTGGTLDFFNHLKFQSIGGEFVLNANDITGKDTRIGGFMGISNFQNFSLDSSNRAVRVQRVRVDTVGPYINGQTKYEERIFVDHKKISSSQWSYYLNPTYRLNEIRSDFFNIYLSLRMEALRTSTTTGFITDTLSSETTNRPLGNSPVFQSGKGFLLQNVTDVQTNGFYSVGLPLFLNSKDKFKLYLDPNFGFATFTNVSYFLNDARTVLNKITTDQIKAFYLFRLRITEQFSGLNITIGGEIRGLVPSYDPTINAYLGIRANIGSLFSKANNK
ncbi:MAG TPA: hypothetical protein VK668_10745 [Mucilaginibacter sp.]|nr:hypothetical protein [Mucilaginibacter sp.]